MTLAHTLALDITLERAARASVHEPWVLVERYDRGTTTWRPDPDMDGSVRLWRSDYADAPDVLDALNAITSGNFRTVVIGGGQRTAYRLRLRGEA